jgi:hypothetical protein
LNVKMIHRASGEICKYFTELAYKLNVKMIHRASGEILFKYFTELARSLC